MIYFTGMKNKLIPIILLCILITSCKNDPPPRQTSVEIREDMFYVNGKPTYEGVKLDTLMIEGLLLNSRMVQGVFDDLNPETSGMWKYPDTDQWSGGQRLQIQYDWQPQLFLAHGVMTVG